MSGLKSAWELSLEKTNKMVPEVNKKLSDKQKQEISEIRKEYKAKIADKDISYQNKIKKLEDRVRPEDYPIEVERLKAEFAEEKEKLEKEMEEMVERVHNH